MTTFTKGARLRRIHFIEIHDQAWVPESARDAVTDALQFVFNLARLYAPIVPRLHQTLLRAGTNRVVDLCSGGGGPWLWMQRDFDANENFPVEVCLTDKYPNRTAMERVRKFSGGQIQYEAQPVDVTKIPPELRGFRTMFTSFHHFRPREARAILQSAAESGQGIAVFEIPHRSPWTMFLTLFVPLLALLVVPFAQPFRWSRLLWTYLLPFVPVVMLFDGIVSCLRAYSLDELRELTKGLSANYDWEIGEERAGPLRLPVTYLIGCPKS
jgi:hypothetical protein